MSCLLVVPEPPSRDTNSHDDVDDHLGEENEEEEKKIEGAVTPRRKKTIIVKVRKLWKMSPWVCHVTVFFLNQENRSNLKALYTGRYQQTKEQGVKRMAQRIARPRPTPLPEGSTQNMAREETTLKSSVAAQTEHRAEGWKKKILLQRAALQSLLLYYTHVPCNSLFHTNKDLADVILRYLLPLYASCWVYNWLS